MSEATGDSAAGLDAIASAATKGLIAAAIALGLIPRPGSLRNRALLALQGYGIRLGG